MTTSTSFTSRSLPWLKLGAIIDDPSVNAQEAARLGGIDFEVETRKASFKNGDSWMTVPTRHGLVRKDTNTFFDFVSTDYRVVQYADAFRFMDEINPRYVAAGALNGGRQGFMVVQFPGYESFDPMPNGQSDPHELYVVLRTSHDRSKAIEIAVMPLRGLCMNQLSLPSLTRGAERKWSIKHVGDPAAKLRVAQNALQHSMQYAEVYRDMVQTLSSVPIGLEDARHIMRRVLPSRVKRDEQLAAIEAAFRSSPHVGFNGTGWGLVNAVSEYFEHGRTSGSRTAQSRFTSGLDGDTAKYVGRTAQLVLNRA